jgi:hypothetical protein
LQGKQVYREVCDNNLPWDVELKGAIKKRWEKWEDNLPSEVAVPRPIAPFQEPVEKLEIHGFGDASGEGLCSGVQPSGPNNTSRALCHIPHEKHCWSDSTVALWWIKGEGSSWQIE